MYFSFFASVSRIETRPTGIEVVQTNGVVDRVWGLVDLRQMRKQRALSDGQGTFEKYIPNLVGYWVET